MPPALNCSATRLRPDRFMPDGCDWPEALRRTTHLAIVAHADDAEFMAFHGIAACLGRADRGFGAIVCTDGAGSPRRGPYAGCPAATLCAIRAAEQRAAAAVGRYRFVAQLGYPSAAARDPHDTRLTADLARLLRAIRPRSVYLHNPADKHPTHVACCARALRALRSLPPALRPRRVLGCEVWRDLDWLPDRRKRILATGNREHLAAALCGVFDSQIAGGKRYDLAALGRRRAHATFLASQRVDRAAMVNLAVDLKPLVTDPGADLAACTLAWIEEFKAEVTEALAPWT